MVVKDEADRYLAACLSELVRHVDDVFVYDDRSDDDTCSVARLYTRNVQTRPMFSASFVEHEGKFRQAAWDAFQQAMEPESGDWVLAVDADEFIVCMGDGRVKDVLRDLAKSAATADTVAALIPIPEIFGWDGAIPLVRVDGLWATIRAPRLFRYEPNGVFADRKMGCGSAPSYTALGPYCGENCGIRVMHFGYAAEKDRRAKFERYSCMDHGHNEQHVGSIVQSPTLVRWDGPVPQTFLSN